MPDGPAPARSRTVLPPKQRRAQILAAALDVFAAKGFAEARLEDIAAACGIGKGTIYLHFRDKQDLFEQLIRQAAVPVLDAAGALALTAHLSSRDLLSRLFTVFRTEVLETRRREILRLIIAEGPRFPDLARVYHRDIVSKGLDIMRRIAERGVARGEIHPAYRDHPQLLAAPLVMAIVWDGLFQAFDPLRFEALFAAHCAAVTSGAGPEQGA